MKSKKLERHRSPETAFFLFIRQVELAAHATEVLQGSIAQLAGKHVRDVREAWVGLLLPVLPRYSLEEWELDMSLCIAAPKRLSVAKHAPPPG